jgi:hypothetical protein
MRLQFPDRPDVLDLMRRHATWPGSKQQAATGVGRDGSPAGAPAANPACPGLPSAQAAATAAGHAPASAQGADGGAVCRRDASTRVKPQRIYIPEEQAVMQELGLSSLTNITSRSTTQAGLITRWRVQVRTVGLGRSRQLTGTLCV